MNTKHRYFTAFMMISALGAVAACPANEVPVAEKRIAVDGLQVVYDVHGSPADADDVRIFIHGGLSDADVWRFQVETAREDQAFITIDLPGHGRSDKPERAYPAALFADAVIAVMDAEQVSGTTLIGHSFGVSVTRDVAAQVPQRVRGLVWIDGFVVPIADQAQREALLAALSSDAWELVAQAFVDDNMFSTRTPVSVRDEVRDMMLSAPQHLWLAVLDIATDPAVTQTQPIDAPVLAMFTPSPTLSPAYEAFLSMFIADLEFRVVEQGTGHFVMLEAPDLLSAMVDEFIE